MAKGEINLLCSEIDTLLTDICKFLREEIQNGTISENSKAFASILIERSKTQLKTISKVTSSLDILDPANESYVDMQGPKVVVSPVDLEEVYSDVSVEGISNFSVIGDAATHDDICPYWNLPAVDVKDGKSGVLYRKERFLFFDQQKKIFAAIQQSWFLIYINEHALKPSQIFDLTEYNAKVHAASKELKKREECFSLSSLIDLKTFQFTALTSKDMLQWVSAINLQSEMIQGRRNLHPAPTAVTSENTYAPESDSSNEYEPLTDYRLKNEQSKIVQQNIPQSTLIKKPLPLPPRNTPTKLSQAINRAPSEESMGDYDCVGAAPTDSFSDEDEEDDAIYDNPLELKQKSNYTNNVHPLKNTETNDDDADEIYDYLQNPNQAMDGLHLPNDFKMVSNDVKIEKNDVHPLKNTETNDDDEIYDYLQNPNQAADGPHLLNNFKIVSKDIKIEKNENTYNKEKTLKDKNKPMLKPKMLSFSNKRKNN